MKRHAASFIIAFLLAALLVFPAQAGLVWCQGDPVVELNGTNVQIVVSILEDNGDLVTGPIQVDVATPKSVSRQMVFADNGFNGYGEQVTFSDLDTPNLNDLFTTKITARIPVSSDGATVPVQMTITPGNGKAYTVTGTANQTSAIGLIARSR